MELNNCKICDERFGELGDVPGDGLILCDYCNCAVCDQCRVNCSLSGSIFCSTVCRNTWDDVEVSSYRAVKQTYLELDRWLDNNK